MGDSVGEGESQCLLAVVNGYRFQLNDLVDVFVGTGPNIRGTKTIPIRGRFKGVRVVGGREMFLVRPLIGSQRGPCPAYPPESCIKLKALGSDVHGVSDPQIPNFFRSSNHLRKRGQPPTLFPPPPNAADGFYSHYPPLPPPLTRTPPPSTTIS